ncbi:hypothetical protein PV328_008163 [Microctonus aethiopoides]|uniref:Uncharacterized protein n=1 Tax=Microctonus aethiopoides TaxID=144406 RepID=A0AA39CA94_9HYME|nr:hypothetical protein PV328_008163 [Microctonus aethiopoides]
MLSKMSKRSGKAFTQHVGHRVCQENPKDYVETLPQRIALNINREKIRIERSIDNRRTNDSDNLSRRICGKQPCGWAIYVPFIRSIVEFITNECSCSDKSYKCVRTDDDLSVSAYVYHCRQNVTGNDTLASD